MDIQEYLESRLEDQIAWYDAKSGINKRKFRTCRLAQIIMASLVTLSGTIHLLDLQWVGFFVPLLGAAIAVISGIEGLYKFQENWLKYRTTSESLKHEKYLFVTKSEPYQGAKSFNLLVSRVEALISEENSQWSQQYAENAPEEEKKMLP